MVTKLSLYVRLFNRCMAQFTDEDIEVYLFRIRHSETYRTALADYLVSENRDLERMIDVERLRHIYKVGRRHSQFLDYDERGLVYEIY